MSIVLLTAFLTSLESMSREFRMPSGWTRCAVSVGGNTEYYIYGVGITMEVQGRILV